MVERFKGNEFWIIENDAYDQFVADISAPSVDEDVETEDFMHPDKGHKSKCEVTLKVMLPFFSYVTLLSENDIEAFEELKTGIWDFRLTPMK